MRFGIEKMWLRKGWLEGAMGNNYEIEFKKRKATLFNSNPNSRYIKSQFIRIDPHTNRVLRFRPVLEF